MGGTWPLVGRDTELARIAGLIRRGTGGLVIAGPSGVGRTRLGSEALALAEVKGAAVAKVAGTRSLSSIPLGVFAPLLPSAELDTGRRPENRPALLRRCRDALASLAGDQRLVLFVDDAHLIDEVSSSLLHQLIAEPWVYVIATVDTDWEPTEATILLWKDDGVERIDLPGLDLPAIDGLLVSVLGGPVDPAATRSLAVAAQGSVVYLRELVRAAVDDGTFVDDIGIWRLRGSLHPSKRLAELVEVRLEGLSAPQRELLELVALGEPITVGEIPDLDLSTLEELERRGLLRAQLDGRRTEVRLSHGIYGQVLRERMPLLRTRAIGRQLGDAVEATGMRRRGDLLRVATWRLDGDGARPELMLAAAEIARRRSDPVLAERLARRAVEVGAGFDASFLAAQVTAQQGRREEADRELVALQDAATSDRERALVAAARLDNLVFTMGHVDRGLAMVAEAEEAITDPAWRLEITAKRSSVLGGVKGPRAALDVALPVLEQAEGTAFVWASLVSSWGLGRQGRIEAALEVSTTGHAAHLDLADPPDWRPSRLVFFQAEALAQLGRIGEARSLSERMYRVALDDGSLEDQAWFAWQLSRAVPDRGDAETAATYGRLAVALFRQLEAPQYEQFALVDLATAFAIGGHQRESRETIAFMDALGLPTGEYFSVNVLQARAWTAAAHGDLPAALAHLRRGVRVGVDIGDLVGAACCAQGLARLGAAGEGLEALEPIVGSIDGPLAPARVDHVRGLVAKDAVALEEVATRLDALGATLLAAEAAADAAVLWRDRRSPRRAAAALRRASNLAERCERPATPALSETRRAVRLTPAERTTALLAANGRTSREIAEELVVSVRTVENHLQHVYEKLGIRGRAELRQVEGLDQR